MEKDPKGKSIESTTEENKREREGVEAGSPEREQDLKYRQLYHGSGKYYI